MSRAGDLLDELDGGNSSSLDGFAQVAAATAAPAAQALESQRLDPDDGDDIELDDAPAPGAGAAAAAATSEPAAGASGADASMPWPAAAAAGEPAAAGAAAAAGGAAEPSQISHRTRKKYQIPEQDWKELSGVFDGGSPLDLSEDEEASEDYRRFCLGTLGALEELPDDDADDEEYYYLHDKEYVRESQRGMFSDLEDEDEDGFEYHPARVSKSELHDLIADKKRGQETHPREPKPKKRAAAARPPASPVGQPAVAARSGAPGSSARSRSDQAAAHSASPAPVAGGLAPIVSEAQMTAIRTQLRQHTQLCAQVLIMGTQQHGKSADNETLRLAELLGELKYFQECSRSYRHVLQRAAQIGLGRTNQGRRPYASWLPHGLPSTAGAGPAGGSLGAEGLPKPVVDIPLLQHREVLCKLVGASRVLRQSGNAKEHRERREVFDEMLTSTIELVTDTVSSRTRHAMAMIETLAVTRMLLTFVVCVQDPSCRFLHPKTWTVDIEARKRAEWSTAEDHLLHAGLCNYGLDFETIQVGLFKSVKTVEQIKRRYRTRTTRSAKPNPLQTYKLQRTQALAGEDIRRLGLSHAAAVASASKLGKSFVASTFIAQVAKYVLPHKDQSVIKDYYDHHMKRRDPKPADAFLSGPPMPRLADRGAEGHDESKAPTATAVATATATATPTPTPTAAAGAGDDEDEQDVAEGESEGEGDDDDEDDVDENESGEDSSGAESSSAESSDEETSEEDDDDDDDDEHRGPTDGEQDEAQRFAKQVLKEVFVDPNAHAASTHAAPFAGGKGTGQADERDGSGGAEHFEEEVLDDTDSEDDTESLSTLQEGASRGADALVQQSAPQKSAAPLPARTLVPPSPGPPQSPAAPASAGDAAQRSSEGLSAGHKYDDMLPGKHVVFSREEDRQILAAGEQAKSAVDWREQAKQMVAQGCLGREKDGRMIERRFADLQRILSGLSQA